MRCTVCKYTATHCNTQLLVTQYCNSNPNVGWSTGITLNIDTNVSSRIHPMRTNSHTIYEYEGAHGHDVQYWHPHSLSSKQTHSECTNSNMMYVHTDVRARTGMTFSIDTAYSLVETDYIFHCQVCACACAYACVCA